MSFSNAIYSSQSGSSQGFLPTAPAACVTPMGRSLISKVEKVLFADTDSAFVCSEELDQTKESRESNETKEANHD